jgi:hypothetical protein
MPLHLLTLIAFTLLVAIPTVGAQALLMTDTPLLGPDHLHVAGSFVPDTTDWRRYFPLEVGNAWQYRAYTYNEMGEEGGFYYSYRVSSDISIDGDLWMVIDGCIGTITSGGVIPICGGYTRIVRYDEENKMVVARVEDDGSTSTYWWDPVPCRLDADFNALVECTGLGAEGQPYTTYGGYGYTLLLPPDKIEDITTKGFVLGGTEATTEVVADFGPVYYSFEASLDHDVLVWARVGGEEYGTRAFIIPTPTEPPLFPQSSHPTVSVYPNPTGGWVTVAVEGMPGRLTATLHDLLGRRILTQELSSTTHKFTLDLAAHSLSGGIYILRISGGGEVGVTSRLVVAR